MKLASLKAGGRDGTLIVVDHALERAVVAGDRAPTLQFAIENWHEVAPRLQHTYDLLNGRRAADSFPLEFPALALAAPLPRAYQWLDGSAYLSHVERVRRARGAAMPPDHLTNPLMYQGRSDRFLGPRDPIVLADEEWGADFEAEVAVICDDVPRGVTPQAAHAHIKLLLLLNDVSLRNLIAAELAKGFGFLHGKPGCALSPVAVTPDELGAAWAGGRVELPLHIYRGDTLFGDPGAGTDMHFDFSALVSHAARTRDLSAGTIIGAGTVSNTDTARGCACIVERRMLEILERGAAVTPFLRVGERVRIEMLDADGRSVFGAIEQDVRACPSV